MSLVTVHTSFNNSLSLVAVPTCLKNTKMSPVPNSNTVLCLNGYRQIALSPLNMKCFKRLVMAQKKVIDPSGCLQTKMLSYQYSTCPLITLKIRILKLNCSLQILVPSSILLFPQLLLDRMTFVELNFVKIHNISYNFPTGDVSVHSADLELLS